MSNDEVRCYLRAEDTHYHEVPFYYHKGVIWKVIVEESGQIEVIVRTEDDKG